MIYAELDKQKAHNELWRFQLNDLHHGTPSLFMWTLEIINIDTSVFKTNNYQCNSHSKNNTKIDPWHINIYTPN